MLIPVLFILLCVQNGKKETQTHNYKTNMVDIFARLEKNAGGPIGQYMSYAHGYYAFPKLEGDIGPHGFPGARRCSTGA